MRFARDREVREDRIETRKITQIVGMTPDSWKVAGRSSMPGPVKLLTQIARQPQYAIFVGASIESDVGRVDVGRVVLEDILLRPVCVRAQRYVRVLIYEEADFCFRDFGK